MAALPRCEMLPLLCRIPMALRSALGRIVNLKLDICAGAQRVARWTSSAMSRALAPARTPTISMLNMRRGCAAEPAGPAGGSQSNPLRPGVAAPALPGVAAASSAAAAPRQAARPALRTSIVPLAAAVDPAPTPTPEEGLVSTRLWPCSACSLVLWPACSLSVCTNSSVLLVTAPAVTAVIARPMPAGLPAYRPASARLACGSTSNEDPHCSCPELGSGPAEC